MKLSWSSIIQGPPSHDRTQSASPLPQSSNTLRAIMQNPSNVTTVLILPVPPQGPLSFDLTQPASPLPTLSNIQRAKVQQISSNNKTEETHPVHSQGMNNIKINFEDIDDEIRYWESAIVCYVIGDNPPLHIIDGYVKRIWKDLDVEKVGMVRKGVFIVILNDKVARDKACEISDIVFDKNHSLLNHGK